MIHFQDAEFRQLSIHHVGNKQQEGALVFSDQPVSLGDEILPGLLKQYFLTPFKNVLEVYHLYHPNGSLELNELYHYVDPYFQGTADNFHELSKSICRHLYESGNHPKIKDGEVYVVSIEGLELEGESCNAVGIFKSENKETYLKVYPDKGGFSVDYEQDAININKLDKGCLIVNSAREEGYKVLVVDQTNKQQEAVYWKDDFLQIQVRNDSFRQTGNFLSVYKQFVQEKMDEVFELEKPDKIDLLNRSIGYFKEKEVFKQEEFEEEVIGNPIAADLFRTFRQDFEQNFDAPIGEEFSISSPAVKKSNASYKSVLKLDKNFHIYVHGKRDWIERGYDEEKGMNYYKVYFEQES